jgi:predicted lipoprotein with Yx(FWY)xxD motif
MIVRLITGLCLAFTLVSAGTALPANAGTVSVLKTAPMMTPSRGTQVGFVTSQGRAVYVFDHDLTKPGTSQCNGVCAAHWPPVTPPAMSALSAPWGEITRSDGSKQLTYSRRPLYTFVRDNNTTQAKGDRVNAAGGVWHLAEPRSTFAPLVKP